MPSSFHGVLTLGNSLQEGEKGAQHSRFFALGRNAVIFGSPFTEFVNQSKVKSLGSLRVHRCRCRGGSPYCVRFRHELHDFVPGCLRSVPRSFPEPQFR